ncbi:MAG: hypothetical protein ACFB4I_18495 [Cyanophyceae cyanobacterium]
MNTKTILLHATLATATVLAVSPAYAFTLSKGSVLSLSGDGSVIEHYGNGPQTPTSANISFHDIPNEGQGNSVYAFKIGAGGDFQKLFDSKSFSDSDDAIADLLLTFANQHDNNNDPIYSFSKTVPFIDFGDETFNDGNTSETGKLVFNLNPGQFTRTEENGNVDYDTVSMSGDFVFTPTGQPSSAFAVGTASVNFEEVDPEVGSFNIVLRVEEDTPTQPVPEPGALLGLAATFGFLPFARKKTVA